MYLRTSRSQRSKHHHGQPLTNACSSKSSNITSQRQSTSHIQYRQKRHISSHIHNKVPFHQQKRHVSFVNAKFQIVQVKVQSTIPQIPSLPPPQLHATNVNRNMNSSQDTPANNLINTIHHQHHNDQHSQNTFLHPSVLTSSQSLLDFATKQPRGMTYLVRKSDLEKFYTTTASQQEQQPLLSSSSQQSKTLQQLLPISLSSSQYNNDSNNNNIDNSHNNNDNYHDNNNQLAPFYHQQQLSLLHTAPVIKMETLSSLENEQRRVFYNETNAKPLQLFKLPRKHEIQVILAISKGDLITTKQIIGKCYYDCLQSMNLLPSRFVNMNSNYNQSIANNSNNSDDTVTPNNNTNHQKKKQSLQLLPRQHEYIHNPQDWAEIDQDDIHITYTPHQYQFFPTLSHLDDFYTFLDHNFSPQTLATFRSSTLLYKYNISAQLQKGGSALHYAAQYGNIKNVAFLLQHGGGEYINQSTSNNSTPLHWACGSGWLDIVQLMVQKYNANYHLVTNSWSVDIFGRDSGQLPIHWAAASGFDDIVEYLYTLSPVTIGLRDEKDNSVVCMAKKGLHFKTVQKIQKYINNDEYIPVQLDIHTLEQNVIFDHNNMNHNNSMNNTNHTVHKEEQI